MKKNIIVKENIVNITCENEFAIISRKQTDDKYSVVLSFGATEKTADILNKTGIVDGKSYSSDGTIVFKRLSFFETHLFIEIISDIIERYITDKNEKENYRLL